MIKEIRFFWIVVLFNRLIILSNVYILLFVKFAKVICKTSSKIFEENNMYGIDSCFFDQFDWNCRRISISEIFDQDTVQRLS